MRLAPPLVCGRGQFTAVVALNQGATVTVVLTQVPFVDAFAV
jgi:hypothetical protein